MNSPPRLVSQLPTEALANVLYLYDIEVLDSDGDALIFWLEAAPPDMIIDSETGLIQWTLSIYCSEPIEVEVRVDDGKGGNGAQISYIKTPAVSDDPESDNSGSGDGARGWPH